MRVCGLASCPFPANHGTPGSIREMAEAISDRGHDVHIVTYHFGQDIPIDGPRIHRIWQLTRESSVVVGPTSRRPLYDLLMVFKTLEVIERHKVDLIHAHGYEAALVAWICRMLTGVPIVYSGHNTMSDELASYDFIRPKFAADLLARLLDAFVPRIGDRCIPHSANMVDFFRERGLAGRTEGVINFGIDVNWVQSGDDDEIRRFHQLEGPVVLYVGVMDEFQRLDLLLEAMVTVLEYEPKAKLLLVVTIPAEKHLARIREEARRLGIEKHVVLTEPQDLEGVRKHLLACDVAVVPRPRAPGFPIKLLNYMSARKPCVMFHSSASGLKTRENALLVEPDTSRALAEGILELMRDEELRERLAANAYQFMLENHDRRLTAEQICAAYLRTLSASGRLDGLVARRPWVGSHLADDKSADRAPTVSTRAAPSGTESLAEVS